MDVKFSESPKHIAPKGKLSKISACSSDSVSVRGTGSTLKADFPGGPCPDNFMEALSGQFHLWSKAWPLTGSQFVRYDLAHLDACLIVFDAIRRKQHAQIHPLDGFYVLGSSRQTQKLGRGCPDFRSLLLAMFSVISMISACATTLLQDKSSGLSLFLHSSFWIKGLELFQKLST